VLWPWHWAVIFVRPEVPVTLGETDSRSVLVVS